MAIRGSTTTQPARVPREAQQSGFFSGLLDAELHGHPLHHGKGEWSGLSIDHRLDVYRRAVAAIAAHSGGVSAHIRGAHRASFQEWYSDPDQRIHGVVLSWVLERVNEKAQSNFTRTLVIADEVDRQGKYRTDLSRYQHASTDGWRSQKLDCIVDTIHFAPSSASRLLQASDLVAYAHVMSRRTYSDSPSYSRCGRSLGHPWASSAGTLHVV